ncbi:MAG: VanW family protein [Patescibacteria group bacterium]
MKLSRRFPFLHVVSIWRFRALRWFQWIFFRRLATVRRAQILPFKVASHESVLLRKLGDADMRLQHNKITNLKLACATMDGVIIRPGETFSFWKLVGWPTVRKGYVTGMLLSNGRVQEGIGGGLCQSANLLYWMALHSPLVIRERHRHSYDIFPDSGRVLPFGTGAAVYYNYVDLQFYNPTDITFQINIRASETHLHGEIRSDIMTSVSYKILEREHQFLRSKKTGKVFRENAIFRQSFDKRTGNMLSDELLYRNHCETLYALPASVPAVEIA